MAVARCGRVLVKSTMGRYLASGIKEFPGAATAVGVHIRCVCLLNKHTEAVLPPVALICCKWCPLSPWGGEKQGQSILSGVLIWVL